MGGIIHAIDFTDKAHLQVEGHSRQTLLIERVLFKKVRVVVFQDSNFSKS